MALSAYRTLLRSARIAFEGDLRTWTAAKAAARQGFDKERGLPVASEEAAAKVAYAQEVAKVLRENVLQGRATASDPNKYSKPSS